MIESSISKSVSLLILLMVLACGSVWAQNKALSLDGDGDYVEIPNSKSLSVSQELTIEMWVYLHELSTSGGTGVTKEYAYKVGPQSEGLTVIRMTTKGNNWEQGFFNSLTPTPLKSWHHLAATYDSKTGRTKLYLDGHLDGEGQFVGEIIENDSVLRLGRGRSPFLNGFLDEVRIWNVARAEAEIQATMNSALSGKEKGLVGYWNFDDGTAKDLTVNGNDGEFKGDAKTIETVLGGVYIPDPNLRAALEKALGKNEGDVITKEDLAGLKELKAESRKISDLTGLEHCTNLVVLRLSNNQISDISALANLTNLSQLSLDTNPMRDLIPLKDLINLTELSLKYNGIKDISPLKNLTSLASLFLIGNRIQDLTPLQKLTNLGHIYLEHNRVVDVSPLSNLLSLQDLRLLRSYFKTKYNLNLPI